jgi:hypothetical protein
MPRRWILWALFFSSYTPLFLLLGLRSIHRSDSILIASCVLTVFGTAGTILFLQMARRKEPGDFKLLEVENRDPDVAAYAATYLLPFLAVFSGAWQDITSLVGFIVLLGVIYVRSRLIYVNPLLALFGYHLWRVIPLTAGAPVNADKTPWPRFLLAHTRSLREGDPISAYPVTDDLLLLKESTGNDE